MDIWMKKKARPVLFLLHTNIHTAPMPGAQRASLPATAPLSIVAA
jgi:hypothetical protein